MSTYPVDDDLFGLNEEEKQLRSTVFDFCQKEIAPIAHQIDKENKVHRATLCM